MKKVICTLILLLNLGALSILAGCSAMGSADKPLSIVVGIDRTGSTGVMTAKYRDYSKQLLDSLHSTTGGVTITADMITDRPLTKSDLKVHKEIKAKDFSELDWQYKNRLDGSFKDLSAGFEELLTRPVNFKGTHILDFITLASQILPKDGSSTRQIWLLSDGYEEDDKYNFETEGSQLTAERIQQILNDEKASGNLPDLSNTELYIIGAGGGDYADDSTAVYDNVKSFWVAYAHATNAHLCQFGPAPVNLGSCQF